jgi:hypothetical protein
MSYKVIIELEYENEPNVENVLEYIEELGTDLDYKLINNSKQQASRKDNMKINEWGVFVERPDKSTYEIKLSEELAGKVYDYIEKLKEDDENILSGNTEGKILW